MAGFVDCTKYNKEQQEQDTRIENLEKRGIVHDDTLKGDGIDEKKPLGLNTSAEKDNAIKTDENGVYVKDLEPQVEKLEEALKNKYDRLGNDLEARIRELNGKLNALKDIEVALAAAKAEGNYRKIKDLEAKLQAAKEAQQTGDKGLAEAIEALRKQGLSDEEIRKIIDDAIARAGGTGRYVTRIEPNQNDGTVTYYYSDGTSVTGKLANFGGVVADQRTIVGNGHDKALAAKISKRSDNKLQVTDDGLYVGNQDNHVFYVSSSMGNDDNVGTREKPLATITEGFSRIKDGDKVTFKLYEDDVHDWKKSLMKRDDVQFTIEPYGPVFSKVVEENVVNSANWARSKELKKPTLRLVFDELRYGQVIGVLQANFTKLCYFNGIKIEVVEPLGKPIAGAFGFSEGNTKIHFRGCEIKCGTASVVHIGSFDNMIILDRTVIIGYEGGHFVYVESQGQLHIGQRFHTYTDGELMNGKTVSGANTTLHWYGHTPLEDIVANGVSGKKTAQSYGIMYQQE